MRTDPTLGARVCANDSSRIVCPTGGVFSQKYASYVKMRRNGKPELSVFFVLLFMLSIS